MADPSHESLAGRFADPSHESLAGRFADPSHESLAGCFADPNRRIRGETSDSVRFAPAYPRDPDGFAAQTRQIEGGTSHCVRFTPAPPRTHPALVRRTVTASGGGSTRAEPDASLIQTAEFEAKHPFLYGLHPPTRTTRTASLPKPVKSRAERPILYGLHPRIRARTQLWCAEQSPLPARIPPAQNRTLRCSKPPNSRRNIPFCTFTPAYPRDPAASLPKRTCGPAVRWLNVHREGFPPRSRHVCAAHIL